MSGFTCVTDPQSATPLYIQIYRSITAEIHAGTLKEGCRMPSARRLSETLGVSRNTVEAAYTQLEEEGYLRGEQRRGRFVCAAAEGFGAPDICGRIAREPCDHEPSARETFVREPSSRRPTGARTSDAGTFVRGMPAEEAREVFRWDFSTNAVDASAFPQSVFRRLYRETISSCGPLLQTGDGAGDYPFRKAVADYLRGARGVGCAAEQIVIGAGTEYLLRLLQELLGRDTVYGTEDPGYPRTVRILRSGGSSVVPIRVDAQGMDVVELESSPVSAAYITPSHQFPLGTTMPVTRRVALLKWAYQGSRMAGNGAAEEGIKERYIIEDDYDSEYRFSGKPVPALQGLDTRNCVVYAGTFSRSLAPSMRVSYMVLPPILMHRLRSELPWYSCTVSRIEQDVLEKFISRGHFERHLNRMRTIYRSRRAALADELTKAVPGIRILGEEAGLHFTAELDDIPAALESDVVTRARAAGIRISGVLSCSEREAAPPDAADTRARLILGYTRVAEEDIPEAARALARVIAETAR